MFSHLIVIPIQIQVSGKFERTVISTSPDNESGREGGGGGTGAGTGIVIGHSPTTDSPTLPKKYDNLW